MRFNILIVVLLLSTIVACNRSKTSAYKLNDVKKNMSMNDVRTITGEPTYTEDLGTATDEYGDTTHIVVWQFGDNEKVTFVNGLVSDIDMDIEASRRRIEEIMDSAKRVGGER